MRKLGPNWLSAFRRAHLGARAMTLCCTGW